MVDDRVQGEVGGQGDQPQGGGDSLARLRGYGNEGPQRPVPCRGNDGKDDQVITQPVGAVQREVVLVPDVDILGIGAAVRVIE